MRARGQLGARRWSGGTRGAATREEGEGRGRKERRREGNRKRGKGKGKRKEKGKEGKLRREKERIGEGIFGKKIRKIVREI
jgi:hypothetical protein